MLNYVKMHLRLQIEVSSVVAIYYIRYSVKKE